MSLSIYSPNANLMNYLARLYYFRLTVLVLAGIIFFIVASMGLCFGFVLETALIIQGCFCYC